MSGGIMDRVNALGRGAAQTASGGWVDELYPKLLNALPFGDNTALGAQLTKAAGTPTREYAGGSAENQYKQEYRADDAAAQQKYPMNYAAGQILGAAPAAIATGGGIGAGVGLGALQGAGSSERQGMGLLKDTVAGGALGGAGAAAGKAAQAAMPAAKSAMQALRDMPPPGAQPALATAGVPARGRIPVASRPGQANFSVGVSEPPVSASTQSFPSARPSMSPELRSAEDEALMALHGGKLPKPARVPNISEAELDMVDEQVRRANNKVTDDFIKKHGKEAANLSGPKTVRPGKGKPSPTPEKAAIDELRIARARNGDEVALEEAFADGDLTVREFKDIEARIHGGKPGPSDEEVLKRAQASRKLDEPAKILQFPKGRPR